MIKNSNIINYKWLILIINNWNANFFLIFHKIGIIISIYLLDNIYKILIY